MQVYKAPLKDYKFLIKDFLNSGLTDSIFNNSEIKLKSYLYHYGYSNLYFMAIKQLVPKPEKYPIDCNLTESHIALDTSLSKKKLFLKYLSYSL